MLGHDTARFLQLTHADTVPGMLVGDAISVFRMAGEHDLIPADVAERLVAATTLWRNLRGILHLVAEDGWSIETASPRSRAVIARASGTDDFDALADTIRNTATRTTADIHTLTG